MIVALRQIRMSQPQTISRREVYDDFTMNYAFKQNRTTLDLRCNFSDNLTASPTNEPATTKGKSNQHPSVLEVPSNLLQ